MKNIVLSRWIFTEAHIGKILLDTHYLFLDKKIQAYVEDDNDILIEDDIMKAISFNMGLYGTTAVLVDASNLFGNRALKKKSQNQNWSKRNI